MATSTQGSDIEPQLYNTYTAAQELGIKPQHIRILIESGKLSSQINKKKNCYEISIVEIKNLSPDEVVWVKTNTPSAETGLLEVSVGLTGVATTIMAVLPTLPTFPDEIKIAFYGISLIVAWLNLYASLWFLGEYVEDKGLIKVDRGEISPYRDGHILTLLKSLAAGAYWILAWTLILLVGGITFVSFFFIRAS